MSNGLWSTIVDNAVFVVEVVLIAAVLVAVAYLAERFAKKKNGDTERVLSTRKLAMIGVFSAIAVVLHIFDFPVFFAPEFYKLDFSEIPALIGASRPAQILDNLKIIGAPGFTNEELQKIDEICGVKRA